MCTEKKPYRDNLIGQSSWDEPKISRLKTDTQLSSVLLACLFVHAAYTDLNCSLCKALAALTSGWPSKELNYFVKLALKKLLEPEATRNLEKNFKWTSHSHVTKKPTTHRKTSPVTSSKDSISSHQPPRGSLNEENNRPVIDSTWQASNNKSPYLAELVELIFKSKDRTVLCLWLLRLNSWNSQ